MARDDGVTGVARRRLMATPTPKDSDGLGHIEHEITQVRHDLGRTVQELGTRLTPAHLMDQAKRSLRDTTVDTTRAVAQTASSAAADVASRTRGVAMDARDQVQAHPYAAGAIGAGIGVGYWLVTRSLRNRRRLVPREWDEPFDRSTRRRSASRTSQLAPVAAAAMAAFLIWRNRM
jgi:ElaB/YqjD/DUF883 family membrane-anchored ribosome-binding protein